MVTRRMTAARAGVRSRLEIGVGLTVLAAIALILAVALNKGVGPVGGYELRASFAHIDGLDIGSDVRIAGVTVGRVTRETVDPKTFLATVAFRMRPDIRLTVDSSAAILSEGLLGGKYLALTPGGDTHLIPAGGLITATQGSISLEALLGKFIGSVENLVGAVKEQNSRAAGKPAASGAPLGSLDQ